MLFVDDRAGSNELAEPLRRLGVPVETTRLDYGDVMFEGRGEKGVPVLIGVEFKQLRELVQALRTERLQGYQLPGMRDTYAHSYLFIEGELEYDRGGLLQVPKRGARFGRNTPMPGRMSVNELLKRIYVLHLCGGLNPWYTTCRKDTLQSLVALYHTWTDTDLDKHKSHIAAYEAPSIISISPFRRTVKTFPGVGLRSSLAVEMQFSGNLVKAVTASVDTWAGILVMDEKGKPRRLGTKVAQQIYDYCHAIK
jgi:hypothetical protein